VVSTFLESLVQNIVLHYI